MIADPAGFIGYENATTGNITISVVERSVNNFKKFKGEKQVARSGKPSESVNNCKISENRRWKFSSNNAVWNIQLSEKLPVKFRVFQPLRFFAL